MEDKEISLSDERYAYLIGRERKREIEFGYPEDKVKTHIKNAERRLKEKIPNFVDSEYNKGLHGEIDKIFRSEFGDGLR